jgi:hypothetical protein
MSGDTIKLTESLSKGLERLFRIGGFALAFGFGGMFLIVFSNASNQTLQMPMFLAGCVLTFGCLLYFVVNNIGTRKAAKRIKDDLPLLDSLQQVSLQLTDFASLTQALAFKNLSKIQGAIATVLPLIESVPFVGKAAKSAGLTDVERLSGAIVSGTENAKDIVRNLEAAIRSGDLKAIDKYASQLNGVLNLLRGALARDK